MRSDDKNYIQKQIEVDFPSDVSGFFSINVDNFRDHVVTSNDAEVQKALEELSGVGQNIGGGRPRRNTKRTHLVRICEKKIK